MTEFSSNNHRCSAFLLLLSIFFLALPLGSSKHIYKIFLCRNDDTVMAGLYSLQEYNRCLVLRALYQTPRWNSQYRPVTYSQFHSLIQFVLCNSALILATCSAPIQTSSGHLFIHVLQCSSEFHVNYNVIHYLTFFWFGIQTKRIQNFTTQAKHGSLFATVCNQQPATSDCLALLKLINCKNTMNILLSPLYITYNGFTLSVLFHSLIIFSRYKLVSWQGR